MVTAPGYMPIMLTPTTTNGGLAPIVTDSTTDTTNTSTTVNASDLVLTNTSNPYFEVDSPSHDYISFDNMNIEEEEEEEPTNNVAFNIISISAVMVLIAAFAYCVKVGINYFKLLDVKKSKEAHEAEMTQQQLALKKK